MANEIYIPIGACATPRDGGSSTANTTYISIGATQIDISSGLSITYINPASGSSRGNTNVTISGTAFGSTQGSGNITFGGNIATITTWDDTEIICVTPSGVIGLVDIVITNNYDNNITETSGYQYIRHPLITSINPERGLIDGYTAITVSGYQFDISDTWTVGDVAAEICADSSNEVTIITGAHDVGIVDVVVESVDGYGDTLEDSFEYINASSININKLIGQNVLIG